MALMRAKDANRGADAEGFVTIDGDRYNVMTMKNFESSLSYGNGEVKRLGAPMVGHKEGIPEGTWSATGYYVHPIFRKLLIDYKNTGFFPSLEIQVTNYDKTSASGRQTVVHKECLIDEYILASFDVDAEFVEEDISGTFDDFEIPEQFNVLDGMQ